MHYWKVDIGFLRRATILAANLVLAVLSTKVRQSECWWVFRHHKSRLQRFYIFKLSKLTWLTFTDLEVHLSINIQKWWSKCNVSNMPIRKMSLKWRVGQKLESGIWAQPCDILRSICFTVLLLVEVGIAVFFFFFLPWVIHIVFVAGVLLLSFWGGGNCGVGGGDREEYFFRF